MIIVQEQVMKKDQSINILRISMLLRDQYIIKENLQLKRFLRENSYYYKNLNRDHRFIYQLGSMMKKEYKLTLPDRLDKLKSNISMINTFMDIIN